MVLDMAEHGFDRTNELCDAWEEAVVRSLPSDVTPDRFHRVELWRVGRQEPWFDFILMGFEP